MVKGDGTRSSSRQSAARIKGEAGKRMYETSPVRFLGVREARRAAHLPQLVEDGLPTTSVEAMARNLTMPVSEFIAMYARIPKQTLSRRKRTGKLSTSESDRVLRFAKLLQVATAMMEGDQEAAVRWLKSPEMLFGNQTPLEHARTEVGAAEVEQLIGRIEMGVYS